MQMLNAEQPWKRTKRTDEWGGLQGYTFSTKDKTIYVVLGTPKLMRESTDEEPGIWEFHMVLSHTVGVTPSSSRFAKTQRVNPNDRITILQGKIQLHNEDPKLPDLDARVRRAIDAYNMAALRLGRVFMIRDIVDDEGINYNAPTALEEVKLTFTEPPGPVGAWPVEAFYIPAGSSTWEKGRRYPSAAGWPHHRRGHLITVDRIGDEMKDTDGAKAVNVALAALVNAYAARATAIATASDILTDPSAANDTRHAALEEVRMLVGGKSGYRGDIEVRMTKEPVDNFMKALSTYEMVLPQNVEE